jgi:hypothetical protein
MPQFPILYETQHPGAFILTEANGQRSRDEGIFMDPATVLVGQPCKLVSPAVTDAPAVYQVAAVGADCQALAIYGGVSSSGENLRLSVIVRDAEVNGKVIAWGAITPAEQVIGAQTLAGNGIIVRGIPTQYPDSMSAGQSLAMQQTGARGAPTTDSQATTDSNTQAAFGTRPTT